MANQWRKSIHSKIHSSAPKWSVTFKLYKNVQYICVHQRAKFRVNRLTPSERNRRVTQPEPFRFFCRSHRTSHPLKNFPGIRAETHPALGASIKLRSLARFVRNFSHFNNKKNAVHEQRVWRRMQMSLRFVFIFGCAKHKSTASAAKLLGRDSNWRTLFESVRCHCCAADKSLRFHSFRFTSKLDGIVPCRTKSVAASSDRPVSVSAVTWLLEMAADHPPAHWSTLPPFPPLPPFSIPPSAIRLVLLKR